MVLASCLIYLFAAALQALAIPCPRPHGRWLSVLLGLTAVTLQAFLLHTWIDLQSGQNLNFFNLLSLTLWLVAVLVIVMIMFKPVEVLAVIVFPLAALSIVLVELFPQALIITLHHNPTALFHIILSVLTFGVLCVAALFASLLWLQELLLKLRPANIIISKLPPLQTMERLLFRLIAFGFVLLTVLLATSLYFYHGVLLSQAVLWPKTLLVMLAWVMFITLLIGRYKFGWRGSKAIAYTLIAVLLLLIVYFGSKFVVIFMQG